MASIGVVWRLVSAHLAAGSVQMLGRIAPRLDVAPND
eukprot:UN19868